MDRKVRQDRVYSQQERLSMQEQDDSFARSGEGPGLHEVFSHKASNHQKSPTVPVLCIAKSNLSRVFFYKRARSIRSRGPSCPSVPLVWRPWLHHILLASHPLLFFHPPSPSPSPPPSPVVNSAHNQVSQRRCALSSLHSKILIPVQGFSLMGPILPSLKQRQSSQCGYRYISRPGSLV